MFPLNLIIQHNSGALHANLEVYLYDKNEPLPPTTCCMQ